MNYIRCKALAGGTVGGGDTVSFVGGKARVVKTVQDVDGGLADPAGGEEVFDDMVAEQHHEFGSANTKGEWIIEGYGADPDIAVENDPKAVIEGKDPQVERAVAELMKKIQANPVKLPARPAAPIKTEKK